nr:protein nrt1/ ptr family 5.4 [Quercus suber]
MDPDGGLLTFFSLFPAASLCLLPSAYCLQLTAFSLLSSAYCLQLTAFSLLSSAYYLQLTVFSLETDGFILRDVFSNYKNVDSAQQKPSKKGGWKAAIFLLFIAVVERFSFFGLSAIVVTYLTNELHQPTSTAAKNVNIWTGVSNIVPLFSAFVADSFLGRFKTIVLACVIYLVELRGTVNKVPLIGSPLTTVAAARKWRVDKKRDSGGDYREDGLLTPGQPKTWTLIHTNQLRCLDKAMIFDKHDAIRKVRDPWRLCSLNQVEEVKLVLRLFPIWLSCLIYTREHLSYVHRAWLEVLDLSWTKSKISNPMAMRQGQI